MNKTLKTIGIVILIIFLFLVYRGVITYYLLTEANKFTRFQESDVFEKEKSIWNIKPDNDSFPEYAKKFIPDEKYKEGLTDLSNYIYKDDYIYGSYYQEKLLEIIKKIIPTPNVLTEYKKSLIPSIKNKMGKDKKAEPPTYQECFDLPGMPKSSLFRLTGRHWYAISRYFEVNDQDYEASLLMGLGIIYLSKDLISDYSQSFTAMSKAMSTSLNKNACDSMLIWASKPKNQFGKLSKRVAKDILDFVKNEYPISGWFKNTKESVEADYKIFFKYYANGWLKNYPNTKKFKEFMNLLYEKPQKYIDKPSYEIEKEMSEMEKDQNKAFYLFDSFSSEPVKSILRMFFNTEDVMVTRFMVSSYPNLKKLKYEHDEMLAKMEFTAIALLINSYYAEKNKLPESIEELGNWFGEDLPQNRLTGEAYTLDLSGRHLMINKKIGFAPYNLVFDFIK